MKIQLSKSMVPNEEIFFGTPLFIIFLIARKVQLVSQTEYLSPLRPPTNFSSPLPLFHTRPRHEDTRKPWHSLILLFLTLMISVTKLLLRVRGYGLTSGIFQPIQHGEQIPASVAALNQQPRRHRTRLQRHRSALKTASIKTWPTSTVIYLPSRTIQ